MSIDLARWLCCCSRWSGWAGRRANGDVCAAVAILFALASPPQGETTMTTWNRNDPSERSEFCKRSALQPNIQGKAPKITLNCENASEMIACQFRFLLQDA